MNERNILFKSFWNVTTNNVLTCQDSEVLTVIIPGIGYTVDRPTMDYSKQLALELGFDVLTVQFGFHISMDPFILEDHFHTITEETLKILKDALTLNNYKKIVLIGKSIGTAVQILVEKELKDYECLNIYQTPVDKTVELGMASHSLVITGTKDPLLSKDNLEIIKTIPHVKIVKIHGGNHSLEAEDNVMESIHMLKHAISAEKEYLVLHI